MWKLWAEVSELTDVLYYSLLAFLSLPYHYARDCVCQYIFFHPYVSKPALLSWRVSGKDLSGGIHNFYSCLRTISTNIYTYFCKCL